MGRNLMDPKHFGGEIKTSKRHGERGKRTYDISPFIKKKNEDKNLTIIQLVRHKRKPHLK